jgi:hypothetical protein
MTCDGTPDLTLRQKPGPNVSGDSRQKSGAKTLIGNQKLSPTAPRKKATA